MDPNYIAKLNMYRAAWPRADQLKVEFDLPDLELPPYDPEGPHFETHFNTLFACINQINVKKAEREAVMATAKTSSKATQVAAKALAPTATTTFKPIAGGVMGVSARPAARRNWLQEMEAAQAVHAAQARGAPSQYQQAQAPSQYQQAQARGAPSQYQQAQAPSQYQQAQAPYQAQGQAWGQMQVKQETFAVEPEPIVMEDSSATEELHDAFRHMNRFLGMWKRGEVEVVVKECAQAAPQPAAPTLAARPAAPTLAARPAAPKLAAGPALPRQAAGPASARQAAGPAPARLAAGPALPRLPAPSNPTPETPTQGRVTDLVPSSAVWIDAEEVDFYDLAQIVTVVERETGDFVGYYLEPPKRA